MKNIVWLSLIKQRNIYDLKWLKYYLNSFVLKFFVRRLEVSSIMVLISCPIIIFLCTFAVKVNHRIFSKQVASRRHYRLLLLLADIVDNIGGCFVLRTYVCIYGWAGDRIACPCSVFAVEDVANSSTVSTPHHLLQANWKPVLLCTI